MHQWYRDRVDGTHLGVLGYKALGINVVFKPFFKLRSMLIKVLCVVITEFIKAVNAAADSMNIVITCRLVFNHLGYQASQGIPELGSLDCEGMWNGSGVSLFVDVDRWASITGWGCAISSCRCSGLRITSTIYLPISWTATC